MINGYDYISFDNNKEKYNISFYFQIIKDNNINLKDITDKEYFAKIGINKPIYYTSYECPNFITEMKAKADLYKYTFSFEFISVNKGNLIIGDELYNYNNKKYFKSQYISSYSNDDYELFFNDIIVYNNKANISFNGTYGSIALNLGVIIGTKEYKHVIDDLLFNKLIDEKICQIDIVEYNNTQNYYVYSCNIDKFNIKIFPKLIFVSKNYLYNFELYYTNLFIKSNSKYYFLIIFKANNNNNLSNKNIWILGQPFYKKYSFTINVDAKLIGLYNPILPIDKEELQNMTGEKSNIQNNNIFKKVFLILFFITFIVALLILTFLLGMKMREERKKRANELKDDNYEYLSDTRSKYIAKSNQNIEMNSKIV